MTATPTSKAQDATDRFDRVKIVVKRWRGRHGDGGLRLDPVQDFLERLGKGPSFIFIGQRYLSLETGVDPLLAEILRKYSQAATRGSTYFGIFEGSAAEAKETALDWIEGRCRRIEPPTWLSLVSQFPWSGFYTSAIDSIWQPCLRNEWRELQPVFEEKYKPADPRNRLRLNCTFLFGCVNRSDDSERPPLSEFEWIKRKQVAAALARRLPEDVTPMGTLAIEGYAGENDWFQLADLAPILDDLNPGQAHLFSATEALRLHPLVKELTRRGKLTLHEPSLASILNAGHAAGSISFGPPDEREGLGRTIRLDGKAIPVPSVIWNQISRTATVLDDSALLPPPPISAERTYIEFRNFLATSDGKPNWMGHGRGFAFQRDFQDELRSRVEAKLAENRLQDDPIILHGQTGTGKTVALQHLAYEVRRREHHAVLYIERKMERPGRSQIDTFCQWAEDAGFPSSLLVWDGMLPVSEYADVLRFLASRGRKIVLVGSNYRMPAIYEKRDGFILAPPSLSESEATRFIEFLRNVHPELPGALDGLVATSDATFLVWLYRLLPPTRRSLGSGVSREVAVTEASILKKLAMRPLEQHPETALGQELLKLGLLKQAPLFEDVTIEVGGERFTQVQDFTGLIMVPGQFGLQVPLEVLLRVLGKSGYERFSDLISDTDIFRWFEDNAGNIAIGPRNSLEAMLLAQQRMGGISTQVAFIKRLLSEVRDDRRGVSESRDVGFAIDLVGALRSERRASQFAPYYRELSEVFATLRRERGVKNSRIMLQEANLMREWAVDTSRQQEQQFDQQSTGAAKKEEVSRALDDAESVLRAAIDLAKDEHRGAQFTSALYVELGSALASKARNLLEQPREAVACFRAAKAALSDAVTYDAGNFYPIDVIGWSTLRMLEADILDPTERAEAIADALHAFELVEPSDLDFEQFQRFQERRFSLGNLIRSETLTQSALDALASVGSCSGLYLSAYSQSGLPIDTQTPSPEQLERLARAFHFLNQHGPEIRHDVRCLELLLNLWWMIHTKQKLFAGERQTLPFSDKAWRDLFELLVALESTGESRRPLTLSFLKVLALFHLGDVGSARDLMREVERNSDQVRSRRRVIRSYLASQPNGLPRKFHGTVSWVAPDGRRGTVHADEIRSQVAFFPGDFGRRDLSRGDSLGEFHIAFNFLNILADPPERFRR